MDANPISVDDAGDVAVVDVEGEHDIYTAPQLREQLERIQDAAQGVVVDLTRATFLDSSVLGALLDARKRASNEQRGFAVCAGADAEPGVLRILEITGMVPVLPVIGGRDEAISVARERKDPSQAA